METLRVGAAFPDPPFNGMPDDTGLDIDLMTAIAEIARRHSRIHPIRRNRLQRHLRRARLRRLRLRRRGHHRHTRTREEGPVRPALPHLRTVAGRRHHPAAAREVHRRPRRPHHRRPAGQHQPADRRPTRRARARRRASASTTTAAIRTALTDLTTGACDAFMKLAPVLTELVKPIPGVEVVQRGISVENIAIAVPLDDQAFSATSRSLRNDLEQDGTLQRIAAEMAGQSVHRPESLASASDQPARGAYHTTRLAVERSRQEKGETSDHPGRR